MDRTSIKTNYFPGKQLRSSISQIEETRYLISAAVMVLELVRIGVYIPHALRRSHQRQGGGDAKSWGRLHRPETPNIPFRLIYESQAFAGD
jgi:hypothetical protein